MSSKTVTLASQLYHVYAITFQHTKGNIGVLICENEAAFQKELARLNALPHIQILFSGPARVAFEKGCPE